MSPSAGDTSGFLPSPRQELLIAAAVLTGEAAADSWQQWRDGAGSEPLDSGSARLLPLVHRNLLRLGVDDAGLRAAHESARSDNARLFQAARRPLRCLAEAGVRTMLLKGAALNLLVYRDGARPMHDVDVLVPRAQASTAVRVLGDIGWTAIPALQTVTDSYIAQHAWHFRNTDGLSLDLHWRMFLDSARGAEADAEVWNGASISVEDGVELATPAAADLLFHVCVHGARWNQTSPIRWVTDALGILATPELSIEWDRFVRQAALRRLGLPLKTAVAYLCERWNAPFPAQVQRRLDAWRASRLERVEYDMWRRGTPALGAARMALFHGLRYARLTDGDGLARRVAGFPTYLAQLWDAPSVFQVARSGWSRTLARLRR